MTETTGELNGEQLARLLAAAMDGNDPAADDDTNKAETLAEALTSPLPGLPGLRVWEVLVASDEPAIDALQAVKDLGRRLARSPSELDRPAGTVLYYAAIARALRVHRRRITRHDPQSLALNLADLAGRGWIPSEVRGILSAGQAACAEQDQN